MKHVPNGREERETARDWDPRTREERAQQADKYEVLLKEERSVRPARPSSKEKRVKMFQKMFHRVRT